MRTLREWREKKVLSQRDLAELSGVAYATISRIESGKQRPAFATRRKLAVGLGVKPEEIRFE